ncbi:MAG: L-fucose/L-arabinose isomerase family protein [Planctomycetota bacterium]
MENMPEVKIGIVGVSRDCFPVELTRKRLKDLLKAVKSRKINAFDCSVIIENESDMLDAEADLAIREADALVVFLGNFGPEGPATKLAERFAGPVMFCAAAEETKSSIKNNRGDAYCGMLNASYNLSLRDLQAYIPQMPVGLPAEIADEIDLFSDISRVILGINALKIFTFGPRPHDFFACNAPIQPLFDLGVEIMENSELDMYSLFKKAKSKKKEIAAVAADMKKELGKGCTYPDLLPRLAQFEVALMSFVDENLGASEYAIMANKCWPAFEFEFGFTPCYVNSRLASRGYPVACEVDIYGALSEYMCQLASLKPSTILDINNTVASDMIKKGDNLKGAGKQDLFMGFHCGNTPSSCMKDCKLNYQVIMNRLMEDGKKPEITRGTLEGQIKPGPVTIFRLQSTAECELKSYVAEGSILNKSPNTFGSTGIFAIPGMARFYRHVLIENSFPHHTAVAFEHKGMVLYEVLKYIGINNIGYPLPESERYESENPFI